MRIIAGAHRGLRLAVPAGVATRPTGDRAREGLFNILSHGRYGGVLEGASVVDLFAGTGAIGLEALSRGAASVVFYETDRQALAALEANVARCRAGGAPGGEPDRRVDIRREDAFRPRPVRAPVDIVFLDPPYAEGAADRAILGAEKAGLVGRDTLVVAQLESKLDFGPPPGFRVCDDRRYGAARFVLMDREALAG